jgi:hypothetical protein
MASLLRLRSALRSRIGTRDRIGTRYRIGTLPLSVARDRDGSGPARGAPLLSALRTSILRALTAERADAYVTILAGMLGLRRSGALAPTLDELRRRLSSEALDEPAFLRDLLQLEEWGCLTRELEPHAIRGYRDARRDRFRHRLTDDVVALLEWLEARLARGAAPLSVDADDRLLDVRDRARELVRLAEGATERGIEGEDARRVVHLVRSIDVELDAIARGLVDLHAEMRRFAGRAFEPRALERVVAGLEGYVAGFLRNVSGRRRELVDALVRLDASEVCPRLHALHRAGAEGVSPLGLDDDEVLALVRRIERWSVLLEDGGELDDHCAQIEAATHDVIAKLRDRMAALERRGDRGHERACAIRALASIDDAREGWLAAWGFGTPTWAPGEGTQLVPPLPRRKTRASAQEPRALAIKQSARDVVREPRQARVMRIADWLGEAGLKNGIVQLSKARHDALRGTDAPAAWMAVARAQHLGRSAGLTELGVDIEPADGVTTVGNDTVGLTSPDCIVKAVEREQGSDPSWEKGRRP